MLKQSSSTLRWSVALVLAVVGGVAFLTMGRGLLSGGPFNGMPPAGSRQIMATMTTLTTAEASPAPSGLRVALTATITPATAVGTVQFKDGAARLGDPVIVSNGIASETTPSLAAGSHSLTAVFIPAYPLAYAPSTAAYSPSTSPAVVFVVPGAMATTTTLATSPAAQAAPGIPVTLTATTTPATAMGTVQFKDGATNLGNPVIVTNGAASGSTSTLAAGQRSLSAVFTPTNPAFSPSTSPPVNVTITGTGGTTATSVALATSPASMVRAGTPVVLSAAVSPASAMGTVQFKDGTTNLGNPVIVTNGAASGSTAALTVGPHQLSAVFTPTNPAFSPATSPPVAFDVIANPALTQLQVCLTAIGNCQPRPGPRELDSPDSSSAGRNGMEWLSDLGRRVVTGRTQAVVAERRWPRNPQGK